MERDLINYKNERNRENVMQQIFSPVVSNLLHDFIFSAGNMLDRCDALSTLLTLQYARAIIKQLSLGTTKSSLELVEEIRNSEHYSECMERYNEYLYAFSELLKSTEKTSALEVSLLYVELLSQGYFSITQNYQYKIEKYDKTHLPELMGARILEGTGVCRHTSSFLGDLLKKFDINTYQHCCRTTEEEWINLNDLIFRIKPNHLITAIVENNEKFFVDTLRKKRSIISATDKRKGISLKSLAFPYKSGKVLYNFDVDVNYQRINKNLEIEPQIDIPIKTIEKEFLKQLSLEIKTYIEEYSDRLYTFKIRQLKNMQRIVELENVLIPHGDCKPKIWILK